jgi:CBS domain-containing protein
MQTELGTNSLELAKQSFEAFCTDISGMFGVQLQCAWKETVCETTEGLKNRFQTLTALTAINAEGAMNGKFHLIFDRKGLFTLGGVVLMPEAMTNLLEKCVGPQKIINNIKNGTLKEAQEINDAVAEACNLLVGSWDRIFRENLNGHGHFTQSDFFIGNPWENPQEKMGLTQETKCVVISFEMKIAQYPPFSCAAIFTQELIGPINNEQVQTQQQETQAETQPQDQQQEQPQQEEQPEPQAEAQPQTEEQTQPQDQQQDQPQQEEQPEPQAEAQPQTEEQTEAQDQQQEQPQQEEQPEPQAEAQPQAEEQTEQQDQQQEQPQQEEQTEPQAEAQPQAEEQTEQQEQPQQEEQQEPQAEAQPQAEEQTEQQDQQQEQPKQEEQPEPQAEAQPQAEEQTEQQDQQQDQPQQEEQPEPPVEAQTQTEEQTQPQDQQQEQPQQEEQPEPQAEAQPQAEEQTEQQDQQEEQPQQEEQQEPQAEAQPQNEEQTEHQEQPKQEEQPEPQAEAQPQTEEQPEPQAETQPQTEDQTEPQEQPQDQEQTETPDNEEAVPETKTLDQEAPTVDVSKQQISDSIKNMTNSPAVLPGDLSHVSLNMPAKEIMQTDVQWIKPDDSVQTAINKMQQNDTGYLLVGSDEELQGIVSNSNIASALSPYLKPIFSKWRGPMDDATLNIKVKWIMSRPVRIVKPETSLKVMIECMQQLGGRCLPVVEPQNKLLGMVTVFDIFKVLTSSENVTKKGKTPQAPPLV